MFPYQVHTVVTDTAWPSPTTPKNRQGPKANITILGKTRWSSLLAEHQKRTPERRGISLRIRISAGGIRRRAHVTENVDLGSPRASCANSLRSWFEHDIISQSRGAKVDELPGRAKVIDDIIHILTVIVRSWATQKLIGAINRPVEPGPLTITAQDQVVIPFHPSIVVRDRELRRDIVAHQSIAARRSFVRLIANANLRRTSRRRNKKVVNRRIVGDQTVMDAAE